MPRIPANELSFAPPPMRLRPFRSPKATLDQMAEAALGSRGEKSLRVRAFTEWVIRYVQPKGFLDEILAIRNALVQRSPNPPHLPLFRYANDPRHVEMVKDPERMIEELEQRGSCLCDCDDTTCLAATMALVIGREPELVALGFEPNSLSHVAVRVREPKTNQWVFLDSVAGPREAEAARRAKTMRTHPVVLARLSLD